MLLPDGRALSVSDDLTLRVWDLTTGMCFAVLEGHTKWFRGVMPLPDGRIMSWSKDDTLRLWDGRTGHCLEVVPLDEVARHYPDYHHHICMIEKPDNVAGKWAALANGRTVVLAHLLAYAPAPAAWEAESDSKPFILKPDGTLVVGQTNGEVCILKLYQGTRRVSLAEAEEVLRPTGQFPESDYSKDRENNLLS